MFRQPVSWFCFLVICGWQCVKGSVDNQGFQNQMRRSGDASYTLNGHCMVAIADDLYIFGGDGSHGLTHDVLKFSWTTRKFELMTEVKGSAPTAVMLHRCAVMNGRLYTLGGFNFRLGSVDQFHFFDPVSTMWTKLEAAENFTYARNSHSLTSIGGLMYMFGGWSHDALSNDMHAFDPVTSSWSWIETTGDEPPPMASFSMVSDGRLLYLYGGANEIGELSDDLLRLFDTSTSTWTLLTSTGDDPGGRFGHGAVVAGGRMFLDGGFIGYDTLLDDMWSLDLSTRRWEHISSRKPRAQFGMATDGSRVFVHGGRIPAFDPNSTDPDYPLFDVLDVRTTSWIEDFISFPDEVATSPSVTKPSISTDQPGTNPSVTPNPPTIPTNQSISCQQSHETCCTRALTRARAVEMEVPVDGQLTSVTLGMSGGTALWRLGDDPSDVQVVVRGGDRSSACAVSQDAAAAAARPGFAPLRLWCVAQGDGRLITVQLPSAWAGRAAAAAAQVLLTMCFTTVGAGQPAVAQGAVVLVQAAAAAAAAA